MTHHFAPQRIKKFIYFLHDIKSWMTFTLTADSFTFMSLGGKYGCVAHQYDIKFMETCT